MIPTVSITKLKILLSITRVFLIDGAKLLPTICHKESDAQKKCKLNDFL